MMSSREKLWNEFIQARGPVARWYSDKTVSVLEDADSCFADAQGGVPRAIQFMTEYAKWRLSA